jgi:formylglycine-generating enzyme required for sulfatase activity
MKLFISYARVDKHYCAQIVETLDVHDVWYDRRLHAGMQWWDEIQRRLNWCDGLVYLLSPDSVKSEYCQKEMHIARSLGKHIFPVLIHMSTTIPPELMHIQYADLSHGLTVEAVRQLLNSILIAERQAGVSATNAAIYPDYTRSNGIMPKIDARPPVNPVTLIDDIADAMESADYDRAVFLLKHAQATGYESKFIAIEVMLAEAESALEKQAYLREAEREYRPIVALVTRARTRELGMKAFEKFRTHFPDYDPDGVASICTTILLPMLEWCAVPSGEVTIDHEHKKITYFIDAFHVSKYPVTNAQYQIFVDASDGYCNPKWWEFSSHARDWFRQHGQAIEAKKGQGDHPRSSICWYEAMAFCRWLSEKTGVYVTLPTEQQWQRAAQGNDDRLYPWGNRFDKSRANTKESNMKGTTPVNKYETGASPFGVVDMAGNTWEWCSNVEYAPTNAATSNKPAAPAEDGDTMRAVRGGSFISVAQRARTGFHFYLNPNSRYGTIGFRVVME